MLGCHSGSALDLPFTYTIDGNLQVHVRDNAKAIIQAAVKAGVSFMKGDKKAAMQSLQEGFNLAKAGGLGSLLGKSKSEDQTKEELAAAREKMLREKGTQADVVQLAGCMVNTINCVFSIVYCGRMRKPVLMHVLMVHTKVL